MSFNRFLSLLYWAFLGTFIVVVTVMFADVARADGAVCGTDLECAEYTIATCEETQEPWDCDFGRYLPDNAIAAACTEFYQRNGYDSLACRMWDDTDAILWEHYQQQHVSALAE